MCFSTDALPFEIGDHVLISNEIITRLVKVHGLVVFANEIDYRIMVELDGCIHAVDRAIVFPIKHRCNMHPTIGVA